MKTTRFPSSPPALFSGPSTSAAAGRAVAPHAGDRRLRYLQLLENAGSVGLTDAEAGDLMGLPGDSIRPLRHTLGDQIEDSGLKRRTGTIDPATNLRHKMIAWRVAADGAGDGASARPSPRVGAVHRTPSTPSPEPPRDDDQEVRRRKAREARDQRDAEDRRVEAERETFARAFEGIAPIDIERAKAEVLTRKPALAKVWAHADPTQRRGLGMQVLKVLREWGAGDA